MGSTTRARRTPAGVLGDALLWLAAIGGAICIAAVIAAGVFHVTLIMFKTGSMEPTIPAGSLAVVHEIPASEVRVGDVVTVDRVGELPVTHRVTAVSGSDATRGLTLRGDANAMEDPAPYVVERVRLVWAWVPGWADVVVWLSNPLVLGGLTVGATALVTWAFWPRDEGGRRGRIRGRRRAGRATGAGTSAGALLLSVALVLGGPVPPAQAAEVETVVSTTHLTLVSISDPDLTGSLDTGVPVIWQVGVQASPPDPGDVHIGLAGSGALLAPGLLSLRVDACPERWVAGACAPGSLAWFGPAALVDAVSPVTAHGAHQIGTVHSSTDVWLLMTLTLETASVPSGASAQLRLQAWGAGTLGVGAGVLQPNGLATTGGGSLLAPASLALGGIAVGLVTAFVARRRRDAVEGARP